MKTISEKELPGRADSSAQAINNGPQDDLTFLNQEDGDQQGMPLLWPISEVLCGSASSITPDQTAPGVHPVSEKNRANLLSQKNIIPALRSEAKEILTLLSRYDQGLSIRDAQVLLNVVNILDQAVIVA